jgi:very-short-patch-repair endonuclease
MTIFYNKKDQKDFRINLRNNSTVSEKLLWYGIRNKKLGVKFRRQYGIDKYILDFYSPEIRLAIEIDGATHETSEEIIRDNNKEELLKKAKIMLIRYTNVQIKESLDEVIVDLVEKISIIKK